MRKILLAGGALLCWSSAAAAQASGTLFWGSSSFNTYRKCTQPAGQDCTFPRPYAAPITGGWFNKVNTDATLPSGSRAAAIVDFSKDSLPVIRAASYAAIDERVNMNVVAIQGFRYNGAQSIDFAFKGALHFTNSYDNDQPGEAHGEGILGLNYAIWAPSRIQGRAITQMVTDGYVFDGCGTAGVLARGYVGSNGLSGEHTLDFGISQGCDGQAISLDQGETVYLMAYLQSPTNRGGFVDALNTLRVEYDYEKIVYSGTTTQVGAAVLTQSIKNAVPEPASWALMISGFGLAGAAARRRKGLALA
jgi:hypothetical protein